ncbi:hypothetical protein [Microvirga thermotolerans]|uniref:Uncharacterized protein n=1 Tax=Microvirga thermotolerans TaxID=2651334 RepID=A0A5P9K5K7_9HYPH|nr:hypothetical protein [Microvirga thermotolerans]QFU17834.1 hypothetical protein GDR74_17305 [Microvirga thermotolerans]
MANKRTISWSMAMRDLRNDRARRAGVREERLRATAGLRTTEALSSWRGRSGRRYIVGVHPLVEKEVIEVTTDAVILAVKRDDTGTAHVIDVATAGSYPSAQARARWMTEVRNRGANEMHVHRLAHDEDERRAMIEDLREDDCSGE